MPADDLRRLLICLNVILGLESYIESLYFWVSMIVRDVITGLLVAILASNFFDLGYFQQISRHCASLFRSFGYTEFPAYSQVYFILVLRRERT